MGNNENLVGKSSMKWYKVMVNAIIPLGILVDLMFIAMYTLNAMGIVITLPSPSAMSFLFVFLSSFFVFYRLISLIILTGRVSAAPMTVIAMYAIQSVYLAVYLYFLLMVGGASYFAFIAILVTILIRIILIPINAVYFSKHKEYFSANK